MTQLFIPYWKDLQTGRRSDPYSWVFFVVAKVAGRHRPIAIASSRTLDAGVDEESLQGFPLVGTCQRLVTIFSSRSNRHAIGAEIALAEEYYARNVGNDGKAYEDVSNIIELPELNRRMFETRRGETTDQSRVWEFPFISSCLIQGIGFDILLGAPHPVHLEPLGTVYRDNSKQWGMVVIDITELTQIRYGIVGFHVREMKYITSESEEYRYSHALGASFANHRGEIRVAEDFRPRQALSASEYLSKFEHELSSIDEYNQRREVILSSLSRIQIVDAAVMELVWPRDAAQNSPSRLQESPPRKSSDTATIHMGHLSFERLKDLPIETIKDFLDASKARNITSTSLCLDRVQGTPAQLVQVLGRFDTMREVVFVSSPYRKNDDLSAELFEELVMRPEILYRAKITIAGAHSASLSHRPWLLATSKGDPVSINDSPALLEVFPIEQIFFRGSPRRDRRIICTNFTDALLRPQRFASGFLVYLRELVTSDLDGWDQWALAFSSCPPTINTDLVSEVEVSHIPAENYTASLHESSARIRALSPNKWTVLVTHDHHDSHKCSWNCPNKANYYRYAFVRLREAREIHAACLTTDDLEVKDLKQFLIDTRLKTDEAIDAGAVDQRLREIADFSKSNLYQASLPSGFEIFSVLTPAEVADEVIHLLKQMERGQKGTG